MLGGFVIVVPLIGIYALSFFQPWVKCSRCRGKPRPRAWMFGHAHRFAPNAEAQGIKFGLRGCSAWDRAGRLRRGSTDRRSGVVEDVCVWPADADSLIAYQQRLATAAPGPFAIDLGTARIAGCWVCFPRGLTGPGTDHDPAWCAAVIMSKGRVVEEQMISGTATSPYVPGLMALRLGPLMEQAVRALSASPDVLLLDATARDHPRGAGLALHLGAELDIATIGVTHRPLVASGEWPSDRRAATSPLLDRQLRWLAAGYALSQVSGH